MYVVLSLLHIFNLIIKYDNHISVISFICDILLFLFLIHFIIILSLSSSIKLNISTIKLNASGDIIFCLNIILIKKSNNISAVSSSKYSFVITFFFIFEVRIFSKYLQLLYFVFKELLISFITSSINSSLSSYAFSSIRFINKKILLFCIVFNDIKGNSSNFILFIFRSSL